ncbi:5-guanidino-2-oxopentanoate decarboxylase [Nordella sp. HKS 07]|uniref:5-guanidino-2-oxopentanoate decarboxylase n=1 Tax=Nordella sp. HKS 07 TaxID=2712222 RepID=UPI0013E12B15|nr:5-guanidino-2-oxopentanoate decarboxylase [Nordella sp. HKS 07]QIG47491.1 5-guanidino-2-oxopentanoate decarboxylase [Nordella sp. HKS 07]
MPRAEHSTGEALVGLLESYGVDTIFGIPGVHNVEMYRALPRSQIKHVLVRHEQGAGFMADGYARATGKPGVCFTITGPGLTNIMTPLGQSWSDSSSVLCISSALDIADSAQGRGRLHEMQSQLGAAQTITDLAVRAYTPQDVRDGVARAFSAFASRRPRPAYLELPLDLLKLPSGSGWTTHKTPKLPQAAADQIKEAAELLGKAKSPVVLLGGGALGAGSAALAIAEKLGAPILTTTAGKGAVPGDHPLCLGYRLASPSGRKLLREADAILCAGSELAETDFWETGFLLGKGLIRIDLDPMVLAKPHGADIAILADAATALEAISASLPAGDHSARRKATEKRIADILAAEPGTDDKLREMLRQVLSVIRESLPRETVIASDMTQIAYAANEIFPVYEPRSWLHPVGFGTLGFALPAGIGAKFGCPDKPVAVMIGDYGIQYTINELGTAAEHKLPLVILMWNNDALGQIRDDMVNKGIQPNAVTLVNPDFQALAKAYRCHAEKPDSLKALGQAIARALKADGPTLIEMTPRMLG